VNEWTDYEDFLKKLCLKTGKLTKGGEPDFNNASKSMIMDWQRGQIPFCELPPKDESEVIQAEEQSPTTVTENNK